MRGRNFNGLGSLSGHASSMITSFKNNTRREEFDYSKKNKIEKENNQKLFFKNKSTPELLKIIKEKAQAENKTRLIKQAIFFVTLMSILIYFIGFYKY